jgi:ParB family transcriptional regulator, chromosome partitioning protein
MATRINRYMDSVSAFENLEIDLIQFPSNRLRNDVGEDFSELQNSVREKGLLQPIIVRPKGNRFEVVAGNRRLEACRRLKHRKIKSLIIELDDKAAYEVAITENVQRKTLDPLQEAAAFKLYCEEYGWGSQSELARKIGKSQEFVSHRIKLLELPEPVRNALMKHEITLSSAEELIWLKNNDQGKEVALEFGSHKTSTRSIRTIVKAMNSPNGKDPMDPEREAPSFSGVQLGTNEGTFSKAIGESVLILRIALVRLDDLIEKTDDPFLKQTIISKRVALHKLIDELLVAKRPRAEMPQIMAE